jgi:anti-sigma factor (TIGR02949 family)
VFSCENVRAALSDYVDGDVSPELRRELERHLADCRTCQVLYDTTRKTLHIVTNVGSFEVPEEASERLVKRIMRKLTADGSTPPPRSS